MANNEIRRNKVLTQTKAKEYYKNNKDKLSKQARERYNGLSAEEKTKKENMEKTDIIQCLKKKETKKENVKKNRHLNTFEEEKAKKKRVRPNQVPYID